MRLQSAPIRKPLEVSFAQPPTIYLYAVAPFRSRGLSLISDFQNFFLTAGANQHYSDSVPSLRGALRTLRTWGGMRWTRAVPLTNGADADGQVVSF